MDKHEQRALENIEKYGCHIMYVFDPKSAEPPFTYSVGLYKTYGFPEIVIVGLRAETSQVIINGIGLDYKEGKSLKAESYSSEILRGYDCFVTEVDKKFYEAYFGWGIWFYKGTDFPVLQLLYPSAEGHFPWEKEFPKTMKQTILNSKKISTRFY